MKRLFRSMLMAATVAAGLATALPAAAQFAKPEDAIKYRKAAMTLQGYHLGRIFGMANGKIPFDAKTAANDSDTLLAVTRLPFVAFGEGTDKGETKADAKIWTEKDKFMAAATTMQDAVVKLNTAAKGGNIDTIKAAVGETGKACKACHDNYRKE